MSKMISRNKEHVKIMVLDINSNSRIVLVNQCMKGLPAILDGKGSDSV
jgi:hypothetical protein